MPTDRLSGRSLQPPGALWTSHGVQGSLGGWICDAVCCGCFPWPVPPTCPYWCHGVLGVTEKAWSLLQVMECSSRAQPLDHVSLVLPVHPALL